VGTLVRVFVVVLSLVMLVLPVRAGEPAADNLKASLGVTTNPWLAAVHNEYEAGPHASIAYLFTPAWELGFGLYSRNVWAAPADDRFGYKRNISHSYNLETLYYLQAGYNIVGKRTIHSIQGILGVRHEFYQERVTNSLVGLDESYRVNQANVMYGFAYAFAYRLGEHHNLTARLMVPVNRHPFDDVNRYSFELGYQRTFGYRRAR
jgi:hypothetical protein